MDAAIFPNICKPEVYPFFRTLTRVMDSEGIRYYLPASARTYFEAHHIELPENIYRTQEWLGTHVQFVFSIGGDGSFLLAAREMADFPVLLAGIHLGDLGFLNSISPQDLKERIRQIKAGSYSVEKRVFLSSYICQENGEQKRLPDALNDLVVGHSQIGKMARLRLYINDQFFQQYPADGLILSTPTGSTSYALSCGGPILAANAENVLVVPICPHMIQNFSMVLSMKEKIAVQLPEREKKIHISVDGNGQYEIQKNETLHVQCVHKNIGFVRFDDQPFFSALSSRLFPKITGQ